MKDFKVTEKIGTDGVKIVVVGVGGGGSNMVDNLVDSDIAGKGAGMKPEVGKAAALESFDELKDMLQVFSETQGEE